MGEFDGRRLSPAALDGREYETSPDGERATLQLRELLSTAGTEVDLIVVNINHDVLLLYIVNGKVTSPPSVCIDIAIDSGA